MEATADFERRWGEGEVDLSNPSLPSLKASWINDRLPSGPMLLLDYGCGEGKLLKTLKRQNPDIQAYGTDIQAPKFANGFQFFLKKSDTTPLFNNQTFDRIVSVDVLEHVEHIPTCLKQIDSQLKANGECLFVIPTEGQTFSFYNIFRLFLGKDLYRKTKDHYSYKRKEMIRMVEQHFEIVEVNYAYHLFGSFMDATFFAACLIPSVGKWFWTSNSIYHPEAKKGIASYAMEFANALCYWESKLLRKVAFGSSAVLVRAQRKR